MLPVEMQLHVQVNVGSASLTVNGLLDGLRRAAPGLESELAASVLKRVQSEYLQAVRAGARPPLACRRCGGQEWVQRGSRPRVLKTSRGWIRFGLRQVSCRRCGRTWSPFPQQLGLRPWQRLSDELLQRLVGLATEVSYAKASAWGREWLPATLAPMTIWRAVQQQGSKVRLTAAQRPVRRLELDGTRVPAGPRPHGEALNLAFQIGDRYREHGRWRRVKRLIGLALGVKSWPRTLPRMLRPELVVSDAAPDVAAAVEQIYPRARHQRCEWHLLYSLGHFLWRDGARRQVRSDLAAELRALLFAPFPGTWRRALIWRWAAQRLRTYPESDTLVAQALPQICYPRPSPLRTTGHAEREMRELNRRTDVGVRWTLAGIRNLLRLRLARRLNRDDYDRLWLNTEGSQATEVQVSAHFMSTL